MTDIVIYDVVPKAGIINLGKQVEGLVTRVVLPNIRRGAGAVQLVHQRSEDKKPYIVPTTEDGESVFWLVSRTDTAYPGRGRAELQWIGENGAVAKSITYQTNTIRSMAEPGPEPDEPLKPYTQAVAQDAQAAKDAAASATEAARSAEASAGQAGAAASNAADSLKRLEDGIASGGFRGQDGKSAYQLAVDAGFDGTETQWLESLKGAPGDTTAADAAAEAAKKAAQEAQKAAETAVLYTEQHLTDSQQEQARSNINAADKARQNILVGTEAGNPIAVDDAFSAPLCGLTVYGKSTQDGTPSPDNPVPIVSVGDSGSVVVTVTGENLLNPSLFQNNKYQSFNAEIGYYGIDDLSGWWITGIQPCCPNTTYHFNKGLGGGCFYDNKKKVIGVAGFEFSIKTPAKCAYYCVNFSEEDTPFGTPVIATVSKSAAYSPYREQLLTLPTPNGLPGIPVTSGGNYADSTGQQWVCDEVNLERGVRVQRIDKAAFDSTKTLAEQNATLTTPIETPLTPAEIAAYKALIAYAPDTVVQASDGAGVKLDYQRDVNFAIKKLEDAVASMTAT